MAFRTIVFRIKGVVNLDFLMHQIITDQKLYTKVLNITLKNKGIEVK